MTKPPYHKAVLNGAAPFIIYLKHSTMENLSTPNTIELQDALQEAREQELELEQTLQEVTHRLQQQKTLCSALSLLEEGNEQPMIEYLNSLGRKPASIVVGDSTIITLKRGKLEIL